MTLWARVLVVVILVLSIVFAGMSAVIFAKRQNYRSQLEDEKAKHEFTRKSLTDKVDQLRNDLSAKQTEAERNKTEANNYQELLTAAQNKIKELGAKVTDLDSSVAREQANVQTALITNKGLTEKNDVLAKENVDLRNVRLELTDQLAKVNDEKNKLAQDKVKLTNDLEATNKSLADARDIIKLNEEVFARLSERNIEARSIIAMLNNMPDVRAKVITVDTSNNMVVLNVGKNQHVRKNFEFTIWRQGQFVAKVNVFDVQDDLSAARIVTTKLPVQRGDNAWTRM